MKIAIINYESGNLLSVHSAIEYLGFNAEICNDSRQLKKYDKIILPGVGAFGNCMQNLRNMNFIDELNENVINKRKLFLGICLGMQLVSNISYENGVSNGLGWVNAVVKKINKTDNELKIPHIGWNNICFEQNNNLFIKIKSTDNFYFVHSYHLQTEEKNLIIATCDYGQVITAAINKDNIFGVQFHPEKSQKAGLQILKNFLEL